MVNKTGKPVQILIVDDEPLIRKSLYEILRIEGYRVQMAETGEEALGILKKERIDIVVTDFQLPKMNGIALLEEIKRWSLKTEVILITGYATLESAVDAMKQGAFHYFAKPLRLDEVRKVVAEAMGKIRLRRENRALREQVESFQGKVRIITQDGEMQRLLDMSRQIAPTDCNVLITGESGTGKELVAKAIHQTSLRKDKPFVVINCAAMPETLLESELFGYIRGAFTGAATDKEGLFEIAHEGCVFLDEIADIPPSMQVKLLRVIQEGEVRRIGDTLSKNIDVRIMAATNKNLASEISNGGFREDLFYRLNVIAINLPSLKDRSDDIPILTQSLLQKYTKQLGKPGVKIAFDALSALQNYSWPGNVRELENVIERAIVLSDGDTITAKNLPSKILSAIFYNSVKQEPDLAELNYKEAKKRALNIFNRSYIIGILEKTGWNITAASEQAGMDRSNFKKIIKKYSVEMKKE